MKKFLFVTVWYKNKKPEKYAITVKKMASHVKKTFLKYGIEVVPKITSVMYPSNAACTLLADLDTFIGEKFKNFDIYVIINNTQGRHCTHNNFVQLYAPNLEACIHEVGHALGLSHANMEGRDRMDPYSFMGASKDPVLNAPQTYYLNPSSTITINKNINEETTYTIKNSLKTPDFILIPFEGDTYFVWISYIFKTKPVILLTNGTLTGGPTDLVKVIDAPILRMDETPLTSNKLLCVSLEQEKITETSATIKVFYKLS